MKKENIEIKYAKGIVCQTLVGVGNGPFPRNHGNCFTVHTEDNKEYRIINFVAENFEEAIKRGVTRPIKISPISDKHAIVIDERIPDDWYKEEYCECCCPYDLLPFSQKMKHFRWQARGQEVLMQSKYNDQDFMIIKTDHSKMPILKDTISLIPKLVKCEVFNEVIPKNLDDIINHLLENLKENELEAIKNQDVIESSMLAGQWIRNKFGLWSDSKLCLYFKNELGITHPDDMSNIILTTMKRLLNDEDVRLNEQINFFKDYWVKENKDRGNI